MRLKTLKDTEVGKKTVFLRLDLDVPVSDHGNILDDTRLQGAVPTIEYLIRRGANIVMAGHLGRPEGFDKSLSLENVGFFLKGKFGIPSSGFSRTKLKGLDAFKIGERIILLENLRFNKGEEINDPEFAKKLADTSDIYVNEAFAASHRIHASIVGIPKHLPHFAGFRFEKEVEELSKALEKPDRPLCVIIGGAKIETKLPLVEKMHQFADFVLVGGEIAEHDEELLKLTHEKIKPSSKLNVAKVNEKKDDILQSSIEEFSKAIQEAKTIVWNGPMGVTSKVTNQDLPSEQGTKELAKIISRSSAYTIVGGGDTIAFLKKERMMENFSFVSTGGGAMLSFLAHGTLPGIEALSQSFFKSS